MTMVRGKRAAAIVGVAGLVVVSSAAPYFREGLAARWEHLLSFA
jgi:hypothetical protein